MHRCCRRRRHCRRPPIGIGQAQAPRPTEDPRRPGRRGQSVQGFVAASSHLSSSVGAGRRKKWPTPLVYCRLPPPRLQRQITGITPEMKPRLASQVSPQEQFRFAAGRGNGTITSTAGCPSRFWSGGFPLVPKLCLGTPVGETPFRVPSPTGREAEALADVRSQAELGNEGTGQVQIREAHPTSTARISPRGRPWYTVAAGRGFRAPGNGGPDAPVGVGKPGRAGADRGRLRGIEADAGGGAWARVLPRRPAGGRPVVFTPDPDRGGRGPLACARIGDDGAYVLTTGPDSGAVTGWHRVTFQARAPRRPGGRAAGPLHRPGNVPTVGRGEGRPGQRHRLSPRIGETPARETHGADATRRVAGRCSVR